VVLRLAKALSVPVEKLMVALAETTPEQPKKRQER
jgi:hypothetical protein